MAITYTENLHLGKQLDKTEYVNWDVIQANWDKIDAAAGSSGQRTGDATMIYDGHNGSFAGQTQEVE